MKRRLFSKISSPQIFSKSKTAHQPKTGALVLSDGTLFEGDVFGALPRSGVVSGEVVFNTVLTGYQEVITDPSYAGQIITFTYPHIGNYGVNKSDIESRQTFTRGVVVRDIQPTYSNWRAEEGFLEYLYKQNLAVISGIDTRRLTRHIREQGSMPGAFGTVQRSALLEKAQGEPGTDGIDLVAEVSCHAPYKLPHNFSSPEPSTLQSSTISNSNRANGNMVNSNMVNSNSNGNATKIVAIDFGIKTSILRQLCSLGEVEVVPASISASKILSRQPDGVFLSNGPGDPNAVPYASQTIVELLGKVPIFGICLGFQLLCHALGAKTYKLTFGHHGGNHPIMRLADKKVEITSQNHNFAVQTESLASDIEVTHINLNDQTLEGIYAPKLKAMGIQYHPEAGPGPHDSRYLFEDFQKLMVDFKKIYPETDAS